MKLEKSSEFNTYGVFGYHEDTYVDTNGNQGKNGSL
jgi:hypothetical protein